MASLLNKYIYETFKGLIKTLDNEPIDGTLKPLSDGEGNELPIKVSETDVEVGFLTSKNLFIEAYGEVIDQNGNWVGQGGGSTGSSGTSGVNGTSGTSGITGTSGTSGTTGIDGSAGTSGTSGLNGSSGTSGQAGSSGTSGLDGTSGVDGTSGTSGISEPGTPGTSGTSGTSGTAGTSGSNGISSGRTFFFNESQDSDVVGYKVLSDMPTVAAQQIVTTNLAGSQQGVLVQDFITPELGFTIIPGGVQRFHLHFLKEASNDIIETYVTLQLADSTGTPYGPILQTNKALIGWVDAIEDAEVTVDAVLSTTNIAATDRMIVKIYLDNEDSTAHSVNWYTEGSAHYSYVVTSVAAASGTSGTSGINGTSGTDGLAGTSGTSGIDGQAGTSGTSGLDGTSGTTPVGTIETSGPNTISNIWSGTQAQYTALGAYSATTLYFIE